MIISALFAYDLAEKVRAAGWYDEFKRRVDCRGLAVDPGSDRVSRIHPETVSRPVAPGLLEPAHPSTSGSGFREDSHPEQAVIDLRPRAGAQEPGGADRTPGGQS